MSDRLDLPHAPLPKQDPERFVLRGQPKSAVRMKRKVIIALAGGVLSILLILSWFALDPPKIRSAGALVEEDDPIHNSGAEALSDVPKTYADVPRLGPPLPGDLGVPILQKEQSLSSGPNQGVPTNANDLLTEQSQKAEQQREVAGQARSSSVMVSLQGARDGPSIDDHGQSGPQSVEPSPASDPVVAGQPEKIAFVRSGNGNSNWGQSIPAGRGYVLSAGTVIAASLITGLNSDLPGTVIAQVTENVCDSRTGRTILIPQGARLIGSYDSSVSYGQRRALLVWKRIVLPDGSSVMLDNLAATDAQGFSGVEDKVDSHGWQLLRGVAVASLLGVGSELSIGGGGDLVRAIRQSVQQNGANAGNSITSHNLDVQPTIKVRPGWPVRALVTRDLSLSSWNE